MDNQEEIEEKSYRVFTTYGVFFIQANSLVFSEFTVEMLDCLEKTVAIIPMDSLYAIIDNKAFVSYHVE